MEKKLDETPWWPTPVERRIGDIVRTIDGKAWVYRSVPLAPVDDATDHQRMLEAARPLEVAMQETVQLTGPTRTGFRRMESGNYRNVHILLVNLPAKFVPPPGHPNAAYLARMFPTKLTNLRTLLFGVELKPQTGGGSGFRSAVDSVIHTLFEGGTRLSDFMGDFGIVDAALTRAGLVSLSANDLKLANSWWSSGNNPDSPIMPHGDHLHLFGSTRAAESAKRAFDDKVPCAEWGVPGEEAVSFCSVREFNLPYLSATDPRAHWASALINGGAAAVSIRGKLEPSDITRNELRRNRSRVVSDMRARAQQGKMERAEEEQMYSYLSDAEDFYATGGPPALIEATVTIATSGRDVRGTFSPAELGASAGLTLDEMTFRQEVAFASSMLGSSIDANPYRHDLPITTVAHSGLPSLSRVGDKERGALIGFSERDRIPAWMDHMAAVDDDQMPLGLVIGQSGAGKSVLMQWLADQYARTYNDRGEHTPVIMLDLKRSSDFSPSVKASGGVSMSLDSLISSDGVFDPFRFSASDSAAVDMAHSLLSQINPFGTDRIRLETPLLASLAFGRELGARCTGEALRIAAEQNAFTESKEIYQRVLSASSSPMFRAICGFDPEGEGLRASGGTTYIRLGEAELNLPEGVPISEQSMSQRTALALVRAMVYGSIHALSNRQGVVLFDEGWIFLSAGRAEMERVGRLARSQQVFPVLFTQRTQDALRAELEGYISRGIILPIQDEAEARAGLQLFKLQPTPERLARITAKATIGNGAPNWNSFAALRDPETREVIRGTVGLYVDLSGNAAPVEIAIPKEFLQAASTNREDIIKRNKVEPLAPEAEPEMPHLPTTTDDGW